MRDEGEVKFEFKRYRVGQGGLHHPPRVKKNPRINGFLVSQRNLPLLCPPTTPTLYPPAPPPYRPSPPFLGFYAK